MAETGRAGQSNVGRIAGVIVVAILIVGGYFALSTRPGPKPDTVVDVAVVPPPAGETAAAKPAPLVDPAATPAPVANGAAPASAGPAATNEPSIAAAPTPPQTGADAVAAAPAQSPAGDAPAGEARPSAPSFDVVRVEPSGEAVVAGLAAPGSTVEVLDGSTPIARSEANERGEWAVTPDKPLAPGDHGLSIRTTSADKKTEQLSEQSVAINVPQNPKSGPLVVLDDPAGASRVLQAPAGTAKPSATPSAANPDVTVDAVDFQDGKLTIAGSAAIGGTVRIYVDGVAVGDAVVGDDGRWVIASKGPVGPGHHTIRADRIDKATGAVVARAEVPFEQNGDVASLTTVADGGGSGGAASSGGMPGLQSVMIRRGDNLWTISRRLYGHGVRFSTIYEANTDQIRDPDRIYPGQVFVLPAGDARWTQ